MGRIFPCASEKGFPGTERHLQYALRTSMKMPPVLSAGASTKQGVEMAGKNRAVFGVYPTDDALEMAIDSMTEAGFRATDISALFTENLGPKDLAVKKTTKAPEGAAGGAAFGVVIGGTLGWLVGAGAVAIPGLGALVAGGPVVAALAGAGAAVVVGIVAGALIGFGFPEYEAKRYEGHVPSRGILLSIHCDDSKWAELAEKIMERTGAGDISSTGEGR